MISIRSYTYSCFALFSVLTSLIDFRINHERMKKRHWLGAICINLTSRSPNKKITKRNTKGLQNCTETELPSDIHSFNRFFFRLRQYNCIFKTALCQPGSSKSQVSINIKYHSTLLSFKLQSCGYLFFPLHHTLFPSSFPLQKQRRKQKRKLGSSKPYAGCLSKHKEKKKLFGRQ